MTVPAGPAGPSASEAQSRPGQPGLAPSQASPRVRWVAPGRLTQLERMLLLVAVAVVLTLLVFRLANHVFLEPSSSPPARSPTQSVP